MKQKTIYLFIIGLLLLAVVIMSGCIEEIGEAKLVIENLDAEYNGRESTIDDITIEFRNISVKNVGDANFGSLSSRQKIIFEVVVDNQTNSDYIFEYIKPNETWSSGFLQDLSFEALYDGVKRQPREYELEGVLYIKNESGKIMDSKNFSVSIPTAKIGDTILISRARGDRVSHGFDMSLNSWCIEPNTYSPENLKDVVVNVTVKNSYQKRKATIPGISAWLMSDKGYVELGGGSTISYEQLYPEEETTGETKVTIPKSWTPVEIMIVYADEIILLS